MKNMLLSKEVEEEYGIKRATLAQWRIQDTGPTYYKLGDRKNSLVKYKREDIEEWLEGCKVDPKKALEE